jgi:hypothetical protein
MLHISITFQIFKYDKIGLLTLNISYEVLSIDFDGTIFKR